MVYVTVFSGARAVNLCMPVIVSNGFAVLSNLVHLVRSRRMSVSTRKFFVRKIIKHSAYSLHFLSVLLFVCGRLDLAYFLAFLIASSFVFTLCFVFNGFRVRVYKANLPVLALALGFLVYFHFQEPSKPVLVDVLFGLLAVYFAFLLFKRAVRLCKLSYLYSRLKNHLDLTSKQISGLKVSVFVSLSQALDLATLLAFFVLLRVYLVRDNLRRDSKLDVGLVPLLTVALFNLAGKTYHLVWVCRNFRQIHEQGTGYFFSENRRHLFNSFRLYDNVTFAFQIEGKEFEQKIVLNPTSPQVKNPFPKTCCICKRKAPVFISRPCNHVIMCRSCQKLRMNQFTNCRVCFRPVHFLWKFKLLGRKNLVQIRKVIEVRRKINLTID